MINSFVRQTLVSIIQRFSKEWILLFPICLVFGSNTLAVETASPQSWSQFLGAHRNGISLETGLIDSFDDTRPLEVWRQPLVGGLSGIAIANDRVLSLAQSDGKQWLVALEAASGKPAWKTAIGNTYENPMGDGPRSTPTIQDGVVYAYTGEGILVAVKLSDGQVVWNKDLPKELECKPSEYGMSCSPLVYESMVVVHVGSKNGAVVALDKKTGALAWKVGEGEAGYSSPILIELNSTPQIVSLIGNQVLSIEPVSGKLLWSYPFVTEYSCNTACPVQVGKNVLISSGENHGSVMLGLAQGSEDWQVSEVWKSIGNNSSMRSEWQTPVLLDGCLYGFDNVGSAGPVTHLTCVDAKSGAILWKKLRFGKGNLIAADGKLIISNVDGELVMVKAAKDAYQELGRKTVVGFTRQAPVLSNGKLYMRDEAEIVCLEITKK